MACHKYGRYQWRLKKGTPARCCEKVFGYSAQGYRMVYIYWFWGISIYLRNIFLSEKPQSKGDIEAAVTLSQRSSRRCQMADYQNFKLNHCQMPCHWFKVTARSPSANNYLPRDTECGGDVKRYQASYQNKEFYSTTFIV